MSITPKMLGSQISSGTLRAMCNEGGPVVYSARSGSIENGYNPVNAIMASRFTWYDENHLYEYNAIPSSITIYNISYSSDDAIQITFNKTIYVADFMVEDNGWVTMSDRISLRANFPIGFVGRGNKLYYFSLYNPERNGGSLGSSGNIVHYYGLKFNVYEITIDENETNISTNTFVILPDNSRVDSSIATSICDHYCKIITEDSSDLIKILIYNRQSASLSYIKVCNLSDIINDTSSFTSVAYSQYEIFDKDKLFILNANKQILQYNNDTRSYVLTDCPEFNRYSLAGTGSGTSYRRYNNTSSGIIKLYNDFYIYTMTYGTLISANGSTYDYPISNAVVSFKDVIIPYLKNMPSLNFTYYMDKWYYNQSSYYRINIQSIDTVALHLPQSTTTPAPTSAFTGILYSGFVKGHPFLCTGKDYNNIKRTVSITENSCYSIDFFSKGEGVYSAYNTKMTTIYPKGFYASNLLIEHNNRFFGISRIDYNTGDQPKNIPCESLMVSTMDYDPDTDTFHQSFAGFTPIVSKSLHTQEVVSINMARIQNKDLVYFDSVNFDYGNTCKIILRNANTGKYVTIYTGEIKEVFDYSSHPIIIEPGYELFVLTTYETWQCTAFGIEIS